MYFVVLYFEIYKKFVCCDILPAIFKITFHFFSPMYSYTRMLKTDIVILFIGLLSIINGGY